MPAVLEALQEPVPAESGSFGDLETGGNIFTGHIAIPG
jgi:hypothetical protein